MERAKSEIKRRNREIKYNCDKAEKIIRRIGNES